MIGDPIDVTASDIHSVLSSLLQNYGLKVPESKIDPITYDEITQFREFAAIPSRVLESLKFYLPEKLSQVYLWGHNFDFDLVTYFENEKQLDIGVSPGDISHPRPYLCLTPRPFIRELAGAVLPMGRWIFEPWEGIIVEWNELKNLPLDTIVHRIHDLFLLAKKIL